MFRLLLKETNIFSIPVYLIFLCVIIIFFNAINFSILSILPAVITFMGVALGYFVFGAINLNHSIHLPLFLYTMFIFGIYPGHLDLGIALALLVNSFILLILTNNENKIKGDSFVLVGALIALDFIFLPTIYPLFIFVLLHIIATTQRILLNIFRLFFGILLIASTYFTFAYFAGNNAWDPTYFPLVEDKILQEWFPVAFLAPIAILLLYAILDHFSHYNKKNPTNRFKYNLLLIFTTSQLATIVLYMGQTEEYLLLLALPASIIISRMLRFLKEFWMQELGLWLILISLFLFKISDFLDINFIKALL